MFDPLGGGIDPLREEPFGGAAPPPNGGATPTSGQRRPHHSRRSVPRRAGDLHGAAHGARLRERRGEAEVPLARRLLEPTVGSTRDRSSVTRSTTVAPRRDTVAVARMRVRMLGDVDQQLARGATAPGRRAGPPPSARRSSERRAAAWRERRSATSPSAGRAGRRSRAGTPASHPRSPLSWTADRSMPSAARVSVASSPSRCNRLGDVLSGRAADPGAPRRGARRPPPDGCGPPPRASAGLAVGAAPAPGRAPSRARRAAPRAGADRPQVACGAAPDQSSRPVRIAIATAAARSETPSFSYTFCRCDLTVVGLRCNSKPI